MSRNRAIFVAILSLAALSAFIYLFAEDNTRQKEIRELHALIDAKSADIWTQLDTLQKATDELKARNSETSDRLSAQDRDITEIKRVSADLKKDLASTTASKITNEIIASATDQAIAKGVVEFAAARGPKFIEELGKELVLHHRMELIGPPGKNANDERVAQFLLAQPDFLTAVSIALVQKQEKRP